MASDEPLDGQVEVTITARGDTITDALAQVLLDAQDRLLAVKAGGGRGDHDT